MQGALKRLLEDAIDYAGLFPPAKLSMPDSVAEYLNIRHSDKAWIMDRFVCSAGRLPELQTELFEHTPEEVSAREPLSIAVTGSIHPDHKHWMHGLEHDFTEMQHFQQRTEKRAELAALEIRIPDHQHVEEYLRSLRGLQNLDIFIELPWSEEMADSLAIIAESGDFGAKARTGGITPDLYPSPSDLANFIQNCVHLELQFKCTAGLHQPLRHDLEFGYINVLTAAVLADSEALSKREIERILQEQSAGAFQFTDEGLSWGGYHATLEQIAESRQLMVGFGSCSVEEPLEGLNRWAN